MSRAEQGPKPNSHRGAMLEAYRSQIPYAQALEAHNLTDVQGMCALSGLIDGRYLPWYRLYGWRYGIPGNNGQRVVAPTIEASRLRLSEQKGGETAQMWPLLLRGFGLDEIWGITGFGISQMHNVLSYLRRERTVLGRPTQQESNRTRLQTRRIRRILEGKEQLTVYEQNSFALAGEFLRVKLLSVEPNEWHGFHQLYTIHHKRLPELYADRLRIEIFFTARMRAATGDQSHLLTYKNIGDAVDSEWFDEYLSEDEEFVTEALEAAMNFQVDKKGIFQEDSEGNRWRPVDVVDGELVIVGFSELRSRRSSRERQPPSKK